MSVLLALSLIQAPLPLVGDTVWLVRTIARPEGRVVRVAPWNPEGAVEALGPGILVRRGDSVEVRYPAVGWLPGAHTVEVPGPVLVSPDGATDSLPASTVTVMIGSVLPPVSQDSLPPPQPEAGLILRPIETARPVLILLLLAALLLIPVHLWWRRRGRPLEAPVPAPPSPPAPPPLEAWIAAGEPRAVLAAAAARVRADPRLRDSPDAAELLRRLDEALFGPGDAAAALPLAEAAEALVAAAGEPAP